MRIILNSIGSVGDVFPFLALGRRLKELGHSVVVALEPNWEPVVALSELDYARFGPRFPPEHVGTLVRAMVREPDPGLQWKTLLENVAFAVPGMLSDLTELCEHADLLIANCYSFVAHMAQVKTGIPFITIRLSEYGENDDGMRAFPNRLMNRYRRELGSSELADPFGKDSHSRLLSLYALSPGLTGRGKSDAPGFFFMHVPNFEPPRDVVEFIANGEKPIVVSLGSMVTDDAASVTNVLIEGIGRVGKRVVIQEGWGALGVGMRSVPSYAKLTGFLPHEWLFDQASIIIHHGGGGTTAASLRAGVPSMVIPFALDQPFWADIAVKYGVTSAIIPYRELTADRVSEGLQKTLDRYPEHLSRAVEGAAMIRAEPGVDGAVEMIMAALGQIAQAA